MNETALEAGGEASPPTWLAAWAELLTEGILLSHEGRISWASARAAELLGRSVPAEVVGQDPAELFADAGEGLPGPGSPDPVDCLVATPAAEHPDWHPRKERWLAVRCRQQPFAAASDPTWVWLLADRSEPRRLARESFATARELEARKRELACLEARIDREVEERHELLSVVSHELRTPLTVISGYGKLLLQQDIGSLNERQARFLSEIRRGAESLDAFVVKLLGAAATSPRADTLELCKAPLSPAIATVVDFLNPLFVENRLAVEVSLPAELPIVQFDPMRLEQVLTNLLGNAARYAGVSDGDDGGAATLGRIWVEARALTLRGGAGPDFVEVSISDDGPGIPEVDCTRIFDPYVRSGRSGRPTGVGLGLAICRRIVEQHGGRIGVERSSLGGCRFHFTLPAAEQA